MKKERKIPKKNAAVVNRLYDFIDLKGMNQETLASEMKLTATAVSNWFSKGTIALENLQKLASMYGLALDWLLMGRGEMYYKEPVAAGAGLPIYFSTLKEMLDPLDASVRAQILGPAITAVGNLQKAAPAATGPVTAQISLPQEHGGARERTTTDREVQEQKTTRGKN